MQQIEIVYCLTCESGGAILSARTHLYQVTVDEVADVVGVQRLFVMLDLPTARQA